jgi:PAS domain S-box-containing protein
VNECNRLPWLASLLLVSFVLQSTRARLASARRRAVRQRVMNAENAGQPLPDPSGEPPAPAPDNAILPEIIAALRESEEQFRRAIEEAPIPVIMHAEDGEVLQISRSWTQLTGYTLSDVPTLDAWLNHAYGDGANAVRTHVRDLFAGTQRTLNVAFDIRTRTGELRHWSFSASSPGTLHDGRRFVVGMAQDITERTRTERVLAEQEEERLRIARDLHDQLGQQITGLLLGLKQLEQRAEGSPLAPMLPPLQALAVDLAKEAHRLAVNIRPTDLDDVGLIPALERLVTSWGAQTQVNAAFHSVDPIKAGCRWCWKQRCTGWCRRHLLMSTNTPRPATFRCCLNGATARWWQLSRTMAGGSTLM